MKCGIMYMSVYEYIPTGTLLTMHFPHGNLSYEVPYTIHLNTARH